MPMPPLLARELSLRARNRATAWTRMAVALVGVLVSLPQLLFSPSVFVAGVGRVAFNALVGAAFLLSCLACLLTADAISSERREGTLGMLFLSRVRVMDVLVGKLGSIGMSSLNGLMGFLPLIMVPLLAGGVSGGEAARKSLVLLNTLFLALAAGLFMSARHWERFRASRGALLLMAGLLGVPMLIGAVLQIRRISWGPGAYLFSPFGSLASAGDKAFRALPAEYWLSLVFGQALGWCLLAATMARLSRAVEEGDERARFELFKPSPRMQEMSTAQQYSERSANATEWLVNRQHRVGGLVWFVAVFGLAMNGWALFAAGGMAVKTALPVSIPLGMAGGIAGGSIVAWVACRFFVEARKTRELELLLTTPIGGPRIVREQWQRLRRLFPWAVVLLQAPVLPGLLMGEPGLGLFVFLFFGAPRLVNIALSGIALCWLGLWFGWKHARYGLAIVMTVLLALGIPFCIRLAAWGLSDLGSSMPGRPNVLAMFLLGAIAEGLILVYYVALIVQFRRKLLLEAGGGSSPAEENLRLSRPALA
jgi:hypothetical protein